MPSDSRNEARPVPFDYDTNPARSRIDISPYQVAGDIHPEVARRFEAEGLAPILDIGCGRGRLRDCLSDRASWVGFDRSLAQIAEAPRPAVLGEAGTLPFRDQSFGAVAALWMLYHLDQPFLAIAECHRVLRRGGLFAASTPSRDDAPELARWEEWRSTTFDAEEAPGIVRTVFGEVESVRWDAPLIRLPTPEAVRQYLLSRGASPEVAGDVAEVAEVPLLVTKRGVLVYARRTG